MRSSLRAFGLVIALGFGAAAARAANPTFTRANAFGDSLSDVGNLYTLTSIFTPNDIQPDPAKYWQGRSSNGPVWVEYLLPKLNLPAPTCSLAGGYDYAYRGAWAAGSQVIPPPLGAQVTSYLDTGSVPKATDLFIIWAGANDYIFSVPDPIATANAVVAQTQVLANAGAKQFLVLNLPPLGMTPDMKNYTAEERGLVDLSITVFNSTLASGLGGIDATVFQVDVYGLFTSVFADPAAYGFTNVTDSFLGSGAASADGYLFYDTVHPTTAGHRMLADVAYQAIPEPATVGLLALCCGGMLLARGSRR